MVNIFKINPLIQELKRVLELKEITLDDTNTMITNKEAIIRTLIERSIEYSDLQAIELIVKLLNEK